MTDMTIKLEGQLRQLKLAGMVNALNARTKEAIANQMGHQDFLGLLLQDEQLSRAQKRYESRYKKACFKGVKTVENYDFGFNSAVNQALIRDLATCRFIKEKSPVLIVGPCGTGKSHIAQALGHCALQQGHTVLFTTQRKLSDELQAAKVMRNYARKLKQLSQINLLIVDDFGLKPLSAPEDENLHELIAERYEQASTMITSNLALEEWHQAFNNQLLGVAIIDRLQHNAYQLLLIGQSYRAARKQSI